MNVMRFAARFIAVTAALRVIGGVLNRRTPQPLTGQVALVTGGSRGLGLLLARELGQAGCRVAICARDADELARAQAFLAGQGVTDVLAVPCDVADQVQVESLLDTVQKQVGIIDLLVSNAGIIQAGPIQSQTLDDFRQAVDVMFWGSVYPTLILLPAMLERRSGHIVHITSIGGKFAVPHLLPYGAAKFAATGFSEGLAAEVSGTGVRVTTVIPGLMRTGSYLNALFKGDHQPEFRWFALSDNLPLLSIDAERAARRIVQAIQHGKSEIILTLPAKLLVRLHGLVPGLTIRLAGLANQMLLPPGSNPALRRGLDIQQTIRSPLFNLLTAWGRTAARRFNQIHPSDRPLTDE